MKFTKYTLLAFCLGVLNSCVILKEFTDPVQADYHNPCTKGELQDCDECKTWHDRYPNEYSHYAKRMWARKLEFCRY